jgi:hypothetical protein
LHYAEIPQEAVPWSPGVNNMMRLAQDVQIFQQPDNHVGYTGNLLFLDTDENGNADRLAVVSACNSGNITAIVGDWENAVAEEEMSWIQLLDDDSETGPATLYGVMTIPTTYLVNKEGVIIEKNLRGSAVEEALQKYLK